MTTVTPVITIDGPSASGKGTLSALVANALGWTMLDSGALYRLVALGAIKTGVDVENQQELVQLASDLDVQFLVVSGETRIMLSGEDVTAQIRTESCGNMASKVAAIPEVRQALLQRQRAFRLPPGLLADGRDMGTVVFPDAILKIFLTASAEERAKRRHKQLKEQGIDVSLGDLFGEIAERDKRDSSRSSAPLKAAADAVMLDTTHITAEEAAKQIIELYQQRIHS
ncbi:MAG: (d)CMP kinase [Gammaproteobacteria bacterium]|nr:(d)CMP kinase [Gammaproteobacteria bacterium]MDH5801247.1 (d)CMP kinase [Gammaproteobacteria bacterium]